MVRLSLMDAFKSVPDPRKYPWGCYPWEAVLMLLVFGMLVGRRGPRGIARLLDHYGPDLALALGFPHYRIPNASQICVILKRIDADQFEAALTRWIQSQLDAEQWRQICIDGKTVRGSRQGEIPGVHLVAAYAATQQAVLAQFKVDTKTNEHKAAFELLGMLPQDLSGNIFTGDAAYCQQDLSQEIVERGGHYVWVVKDNQQSLKTDVEAGLVHDTQSSTFTPSRPSGSPAPVGASANYHVQ